MTLLVIDRHFEAEMSLKIVLFICFFSNSIMANPFYEYEHEDTVGDDDGAAGIDEDLTRILLGEEGIYYVKHVEDQSVDDDDDDDDEGFLDDDIIWDDRQFVVGPNEKNKDNSWELLNSQKYLWPSGVIPIRIKQDFTQAQKNLMYEAMKYITSLSCVKFVSEEAGNYIDFVSITKPKHWKVCRSSAGKVGKEQPLYFGSRCFKRLGILIHEFLHVTGLFHEQGRPDRESYVSVQWKNIAKLKVRRVNFKQRDWGYISDACEPYDFLSIMHYGMRKDGKSMMVAKKDKVNRMMVYTGQREQMSTMDILKLNRMYGCHEDCKTNCKPPYDIRDLTNKCKKCPLKTRPQCLKKLAQLTYCH